MKTILKKLYWKKCAPTKNLLILGLALSALSSVMDVAGAGKPAWVPSQAVSVYPAEVYPDGPPLNALISNVPGDVAGGPTIIWDWYFEARIELDTYPMGVAGIGIGLILDRDNRVISIHLRGQAGPPGGPWPWHDTDVIPVANQPVFNLVTGFTLQIRLDNIPVYRHATTKNNSPRVGVAGSVSLGDLVISPKN